jgi:hypothetical protein
MMKRIVRNRRSIERRIRFILVESDHWCSRGLLEYVSVETDPRVPCEESHPTMPPGGDGSQHVPAKEPGGHCVAAIDAPIARHRRCYSITSSARAVIESGTLMPSAFAALRLSAMCTLVTCCTGKSLGFSPFSTRPA